ncbi:MAG: MopE-related protein [Myxococcota bacterium]
MLHADRHTQLSKSLQLLVAALLPLAACGEAGLAPAPWGEPGEVATESHAHEATVIARRATGPVADFVGPTMVLPEPSSDESGDALAAGVSAAGTVSLANTVAAFPTGSLIIPMDLTFQDDQPFRAFGLIYELLRNQVPVHWIVQTNKSAGAADFIVSSVDTKSGTTYTNQAYRGGPFVIAAANASVAQPIINAWQSSGKPRVHRATATFNAQVARTLVVAPTIAIFRDGGEAITRGYLSAAGIPDSTGSTSWPSTGPDTLSLQDVTGISTGDHREGSLFDEDGDPVYCHFASTHWTFAEAQLNPEVGAEVRSFLTGPTQLFAGCEAALAFENDPTNGYFLTPNGLLTRNYTGNGASLRPDRVLAQYEGTFLVDSSGTRGYSPCTQAPPATCVAGGAYKASVEAMIVRNGYAQGSYDTWVSGYLDGACPPETELCETAPGEWAGRVNYLGGHQYSLSLPVSSNAEAIGARLFLQSIFASPCASVAGQPVVTAVVDAPSSTASPTITVAFTAHSSGPTTARDAKLVYTIPSGSTFVSASEGGIKVGGTVVWALGNLGAGEAQTHEVVVTLGSYGTYSHAARIDYQVAMNAFTRAPSAVPTNYGVDTDGDGVIDSEDDCPTSYDPMQDLSSDPANCGGCAAACATSNGTPGCEEGVCTVAACNPGYADCDGHVSSGCEFDTSGFQNDASNCGLCGNVCTSPNGTVDCVAAECTMVGCPATFADCNGDHFDGCEYDVSGFSTDSSNCGACGAACALSNATSECAAGACGIVACEPGFFDCNGSPSDGCERDEDSLEMDVDHCGACGNACSMINGTPACASGICTLGSCDAGFANCNLDIADGCEFDAALFAADVNNCGGCGISCTMAGGTGACVSGTCQVSSCDAGFHDCNGDPSDGCEVADGDFATDVNNCGGCGVVCSNPTYASVCNAGVCEIETCGSGFVGKTCGLGVCESYETCYAGLVRKCEPGAPTLSPEVNNCDTLDNDCDGLTDEEYDDGVACTVSTCISGVATNTPDDSLCADSNPCTDDWCHASFGCVSFPDDSNTPDPAEDDGNPCTDLVCTYGSSVNVPDDTNIPDDARPCTLDTCDNGTEIHTVIADTCLIDGACYAPGDVKDGTPCGVCNPSVNQFDFDSKVFQDDFDDADVSDWTIVKVSSGATTWQLSSTRNFSASRSLWFGRSSTGTYADSDKRVQAYAQTKLMYLPAGTTPQLSFRLWLETQRYTSAVTKDVLRVEVVDSVGTVTAIWNSTTTLEGTTNGGFYPIFVGLGDWAGQSIRLRFRFDSYDGSSNGYEGAYIDDVNVDTACCLASSDCDDGDACTVDLCNAQSCNHVDTCSCAPARSELMVLLDFSGSMTSAAEIGGSVSKWNAAVGAIGDSLAYFSPLLTTALKLFRTPGSATSCTVTPRSLEQPFGSEPADVLAYLQAKTPSGSTPMAAGLQGARDIYRTLPAVGDGRFVLLVTDGKESCGGDAVARVTDLANDGVVTYVLGFGSGVDANVLNAAAVSGGRGRPQLYPGDKSYWSASSSEEVELAIANIITEVVSEQCNGQDDDCDGQIDEGVADIGCVRPDCNGNPQQGVRKCVDGAWGACSADPKAERCNGVDDNCSGIIDDPWKDNVGPKLGTSCTVGVGACKRTGTWVCPVDQVSEAVCSAMPGSPSPEICDNIDNDCDGVTDESQSRSCTAGCNSGTETCYKGKWVLCTAVADPDNQCDGIDNDCDGVTDPLYPMSGLACDGTDSDLCAYGTWTCKSSGYGVECVNENPTNLVEICGGGDEDCDGFTDEEGAVGCTLFWKDLDGDGFGAGTPKCLCAPRGAFNTPNGDDCDDTRPLVNPNGLEVCNSLDDDCNTFVDEDPNDPTQPLRQTCYTGPADTLNVGACHAGLETCDGGAWDVCTDERVPMPELCDGIDGDCDGFGDLDEPGATETMEEHPCAATSYCWFDTCYCVLNDDVNVWQCILE